MLVSLDGISWPAALWDLVLRSKPLRAFLRACVPARAHARTGQRRMSGSLLCTSVPCPPEAGPLTERARLEGDQQAPV